jgi:hypothetical protein
MRQVISFRNVAMTQLPVAYCPTKNPTDSGKIKTIFVALHRVNI